MSMMCCEDLYQEQVLQVYIFFVHLNPKPFFKEQMLTLIALGNGEHQYHLVYYIKEIPRRVQL